MFFVIPKNGPKKRVPTEPLFLEIPEFWGPIFEVLGRVTNIAPSFLLKPEMLGVLGLRSWSGKLSAWNHETLLDRKKNLTEFILVMQTNSNKSYLDTYLESI